jgi:putative hydrolase of the HAD superfamily
VKRIVFDLGAVLLTWRPQELLRRAWPSRIRGETEADHWAQEIFGSRGVEWADYDRGTVGLDALVLRIAQRTAVPAVEVRQLVESVPGSLAPIAPTVALLHRLADAGHTLHYLSNMPAPMADHIERQHPFFARFASGVFSGRVHLLKPEPAIFELANRRFGGVPHDLVFMDDSLANVHAAQACGWHALHFTDADAAARELSAHGWAKA